MKRFPDWVLGVLGFFVLAQFIDGRLAFLISVILVVTLPFVRSRKENAAVKHAISDIGLSDEQGALLLGDLQKRDHKSAEHRIAEAQEMQRMEFKKATGVDPKDITPEIGREISWNKIINHAFRILEFDRSGTIIAEDGHVQALSDLHPYGYLLVDSPTLNQAVRLPIIHRDDFLLAASVFDEPQLAKLVTEQELLVTYAPKHVRRKDGRSASPDHVLHFVLTLKGTLESYYSENNDVRMVRPEPEKLFGQFIYQGEIAVKIS